MIIRQGGNTSQDTPKDDTVEGRSYLVHNDMPAHVGQAGTESVQKTGRIIMVDITSYNLLEE